jgi:hypothetical protein
MSYIIINLMPKIKAAIAALQTERQKTKILSRGWKTLLPQYKGQWERLPAANMNHAILKYNFLCVAAKIFIHLFGRWRNGHEKLPKRALV